LFLPSGGTTIFLMEEGAIMGARTINAILGLWLFTSAFVWPHGRAQFTNATVVGMLAVTLALLGLRGRTWPRLSNTALGGWLILSSLFLPRVSMATFWNHIFVGLAMALLGASPGLRNLRRRTPVAP
jgi:hypothetical protein